MEGLRQELLKKNREERDTCRETGWGRPNFGAVERELETASSEEELWNIANDCFWLA